MIEVKNRSVESWGPFASMSDNNFKSLINVRKTMKTAKDMVKKQKKLKKYKVQFIKEWQTDSFELEAEDDYSVGTVAQAYFKENQQTIGFKEKEKFPGSFRGYDRISYTKVRI